MALNTKLAQWVGPLLMTAALGGCASGGSVSEADRMFLGGAASWDANKDNLVTCDEWKTFAAAMFTRVDIDRNSTLIAEEFQSLVKIDRTYSIADLKYFDANRDGKVDRAEYVDRQNPVFTLADKNKDCQLDSAEMAAARGMAAPPPPPAPMLNPKEGV